MPTHRVAYGGAGIARVLLDDRPQLTLTGGADRGITLSGKTHEITFAVADQAGNPYSLSVRPEDGKEPVWQKKGKVSSAGLEVGTDEFSD